MILHSLKEYYDRKSSDPESGIAPEGFEKKEIPFLIVINEQGEFVEIEDTREKVGSRLIGKTFLLPRSKGRSGRKSYEITHLLWDHIGYLLGLPTTDSKSANQHQTWLKMLDELPEPLSNDVGVNAVKMFYLKGEVTKAIVAPEIKECLKIPQCNMAFRLVSDIPVPCRDAVKEFVVNGLKLMSDENDDDAREDDVLGICLVTGERGVIARTHGRTPIDRDSKNLIGFQKSSGYDSYGKQQGYNAPIIKSTEFAYVTALNNLLANKSQRLLIGDTTTVFWSKNKSALETDFLYFFEEPPKDDPDLMTEKVKGLFESIESGAYIDDDGNDAFYILGLSPNVARISVRYWHIGTIFEFSTRIRRYFNDFKIVKPPNELEHYSIWRILVNAATQDKSENIPPNLAGEFMRSIIGGVPYPTTLLQAVLRRIRSDTKGRVKPIRAATIKAFLNRYYQFYPTTTYKEVTMDLDTNQISQGYHLGRLFAVLEKIQEEANPNINSTIRERFYGAACSSPITVYPNLLKLKNHHLAKLENKGRVVNFEQLLGEIMRNFDSFPAHLNMHEQGMFAIGYYHQRQDFFTPKNKE